MKKLILIDSNFFIALINRKDQWHDKSKRIIDKIEHQEKMVTDGVITEAITLTGSLLGGKIASTLYNNIKDNYKIHTTYHLYDKGMITHLKYDGKLSLVDALLLETMKELKINKIVTFNKDFDNKNNIIRIH